MSATLNVKSQAAVMLQKMKMQGGGEVDQKKIEEIKEQERNHDFLNLEHKMKEEAGKEY
jgi:hypothetical protein